ncbi:hypothetical protein D3C83_37890 [compost metagenome]
MKTRLTRIPARAASSRKCEKPAAGSSRASFRSAAQTSVMARLASGPAAATHAMCGRGLRNAE